MRHVFDAPDAADVADPPDPPDPPDIAAADDPPPQQPRADRTHLHRQSNLTLRTDDGVMLWARMRALMEGTTVSRLIRGWLEEYARVPPRFWDGYPPPWDVNSSDPPGSSGARSDFGQDEQRELQKPWEPQERPQSEEERPQPVRERSSWG